jgi:uncharacterized protein YabE (DUF348 family)
MWEKYVRKIIPLVVAGATTFALSGGALAYAGLDHDVTLSVDGQAREVSSTAGTVGELLEAQDIKVGEHDVVAPAPTTDLADGTRVAVQFGRPVTFSVDGKPQTIWTTATEVGQAIGALGLNTTGADLSTSRSTPIGRQGLTVDVATPKKVVLTAAGKKREVTTTATTVGALLSEQKVKVDGDDKLSVPASTALTDGAKVRWTKVDVSTAKKKSAVAFDVVRKKSSKLTKGTTKVQTRGVKGTRVTTYKVVEHDGKEDSRSKTGSKVTRKPVNQVLLVGTKAPASSGGSSSINGGVWDRIAKCESGGNWSINTGNGYYGGLQFSLPTWRSVGGSGLPSEASKAEQISRATKLQQRSGWGQWSCAGAR